MCECEEFVAESDEQRSGGIRSRFVRDTEAVYLQHVQARNRLRYISGMLTGILVIVAIVSACAFLASGPLMNVLAPASLLFVTIFAGMGAMTSVLTRLSEIDLRDQTSIQVVFVSGMARPVTAVFLALAVALVLTLRIVDVHLGTASTDPVPVPLLAVAAFLCGFSERFAQDVLARVGGEALHRPAKASSTRSRQPRTTSAAATHSKRD